MNIKKYLERIKYTAPISINFEVLSKLQLCHLNNIPFENLDIHNHTKIDLSNLFDKIITRKRGGFCYELNGLFYQLLQAVGFTVKMVSARIYDRISDYCPEFDHMALIVTINADKYLVDVGFGEFIAYPLPIVLNIDSVDPQGVFRMEIYDEFYTVINKRQNGGNLVPQYIFSEKERQICEFYEMCNYHQTNTASHFTQKVICSLPTASGRITLTGDIFKVTENGAVTETRLNSKEEVSDILITYFGIRL